MKIAAMLLVVLALVIGIVPHFTDCASQGRAITLADGRQIPMKCHWTGQGEMAVSVPLFATGSILGVTRRRETWRATSLIGFLLGAFAILLPTALIGVCPNPEMLCNSIMKPTLILSGILVAIASALVFAQSFRSDDFVG